MKLSPGAKIRFRLFSLACAECPRPLHSARIWPGPFEDRLKDRTQDQAECVGVVAILSADAIMVNFEVSRRAVQDFGQGEPFHWYGSVTPGDCMESIKELRIRCRLTSSRGTDDES